MLQHLSEIDLRTWCVKRELFQNHLSTW